MPTRLREFYWRELVSAKDAEAKVYDTALKKNTKSSSGRASRR